MIMTTGPHRVQRLGELLVERGALAAPQIE
ncbi:MAG: hypothetical protein RL760_1341, partial [Candidatus Eisenbacteria bacterium]